MRQLNLLSRRLAAAAAVALALGAATACDDDDPTEPDEEPEVATMRLTVGTQIINVASNGAVTGGPIRFPVGTRSISAQFLRADGQPEPLVTAQEFELRATPANTGIVTFTRTGAFTGTLTGVTANSTTISFQLWHTIEQHADFGPFSVQVTIDP